MTEHFILCFKTVIELFIELKQNLFMDYSVFVHCLKIAKNVQL